MSSSKNLAEFAIIAIVVVSYGWNAPEIISGASSNFGGGDASAGDITRQVVFLAILAVTLHAWSQDASTRRFPIPPFILPLLIWCWLSVFWAADPSIAFRRIGFTTIVIVAICCCVDVLPPERVMSSLMSAFWIILLADWAAVLTVPGAVHSASEADSSIIGDWRGIQPHKNDTGPFCAIALIFFLHQAVRRKSWRSELIPIVLSAAFLVGTHSKTSMAFVFVALCWGLLAIKAFEDRRIRHVIFLVVVGAVLPMCILLWDDVAKRFVDLIDDPTALTGRVQIWPLLADFVADHPLLGAGYGSFWGVGGNSAAGEYTTGWVSELYSAHNGYLELTVQVGLIGLVLLVLFLIVYPLRIIVFTPLAAGASRSLFCAVLSFCWMRDSMESSMFDRSNPTWVMMMFMYCLLNKAHQTTAVRQPAIHTGSSLIESLER